MKLNHVQVKANDIEAMQQFFVEVIGLESGYRPPFPFKGAWLYSENQPIIHLSESTDSSERTGNALVDHIAFEVADFDGLMSRLREYGNPFSSTTVPDSGRRQVFVSGPEGIRIEMQFPAASQT